MDVNQIKNWNINSYEVESLEDDYVEMKLHCEEGTIAYSGITDALADFNYYNAVLLDSVLNEIVFEDETNFALKLTLLDGDYHEILVSLYEVKDLIISNK